MGNSTIVTPNPNPTIMSAKPTATAIVCARIRSPVSTMCRSEAWISFMAALSAQMM
jgi:hypothetical protein